VLLIAGLTSIIGAAYTSVSFLKTLFKPIAKHEKYVTIGFIVFSTCVMSFIGQPAALLVLVGFLNGLILPVTMTVMLFACRRKDIVGDEYKHPVWLIIIGILVVLLTAYMSISAMPNVPDMFRALFN